MPTLIQSGPLADAVARLSAKTPVGSVLKSKEWQGVPLALRERALFSATIESAEFLESAQAGILEIAQNARRLGGDGAFQSKQQLVADLQGLAQRLGLQPADPAKQGTIEDVTSLRRLDLIVDFNTTQAQEFARFKADQDPDVLDAWPAQELIRIEQRDVPRGFRRGKGGAIYPVPGDDWPARWREAGGTLIGGRMVALKNDPVWTSLSRFGTPFPPFDFQSGMGLEDIDRAEAEELGLIKPGETPESAEPDFNANLSASVENLSPRMQSSLGTIFGDQVTIEDGRAEWKGAAA